MERVLLLHKNIGETPLECLERFKNVYPEYQKVPLTYAGRLDPMAEGLLLVLAAEEVYEKKKYLDLAKKYEFEVLWGFETDTYDALGLITEQTEKIPSNDEIQMCLKNFVGKHEQVYPIYSSKPFKGRPLFAWARGGEAESIEVPKKEIEIFDLIFKGSRMLAGKKLKQTIFDSIDKVRGDFRQESIKESWEKNISLGKKYFISSFEVNCSSGTYVRALAKRLGDYFNSNGIAIHIKRRTIGEYSLDELGVDRD